ncbi:MAG: acyl carrier protein [Rhodospirillales bacterium]|jgi:acyl carrier protein|nr:acyl carrier protein [Rhodospirillales bacterium]
MDRKPPISPDALIAEALDCSPGDITDGLGLGLHPKWDSLAHLRVMMALEQHYDVSIDDDSIKKFHTRDSILERYSEITGG